MLFKAQIIKENLRRTYKANQAYSKHGWIRHKAMKYSSVQKAQPVETGHIMGRKKISHPCKITPIGHLRADNEVNCKGS